MGSERKVAPLEDFLDYEVRSSWWASWIGWDWGQELAGSYFAWKTRRKYTRYKTSALWLQRIKHTDRCKQ